MLMHNIFTDLEIPLNFSHANSFWPRTCNDMKKPLSRNSYRGACTIIIIYKNQTDCGVNNILCILDQQGIRGKLPSFFQLFNKPEDPKACVSYPVTGVLMREL